MRDIVELLQQLGFGEYEARAYVTLTRESPQSGYLLAKLSGIPRANIYSVLQKLEDRTAILRVDTPSGVRYAPVPPGELIGRIRSGLDDVLQAVEQSFSGITVPPEPQPIWNVRGRAALLDHARALVDAARGSLFIAIWPPEAGDLADSLLGATERAVRLSTLCLAPCAGECGACQGQIFRYRMPPEKRKRWLIVNVDDAELLAGEIGVHDDDTLAVRTRQRLVVDAVSWYMRHTVAVGSLLSDAGDRLPELLTPEARSVLAAVGPDSPNGGWLEHMMDLLHRPPLTPGAPGSHESTDRGVL